jgi:predicted acyltransferase
MLAASKFSRSDMKSDVDQPIVIHPPGDGDLRSALDTPASASLLLAATVARTNGDGGIAPERPVVRTEAAKGERSLALDALRGVLMIAMVFALTIPRTAGLPAWMYHVQYPPPDEAFRAIAGLGWRDLVFPGFLFTMAAAIPLATTRFLATGMPYPAIIWRGVKRAVLLFAFALLIGHTNPFWTENYTKTGNLIAIAGFLACWPLLLQKKPEWREDRFRIFRFAGYAVVALILFALPALYGKTFSLDRKDNIIHALAVSGFITLIIWLFTRRNLQLRMFIVAAMAAVKIAAAEPGWIRDMWGYSSWFFAPWFVELLIITVPGTVAGDLLHHWLSAPADAGKQMWNRARTAAVPILTLLITIVMLMGLYTREVGIATGIMAVMAIIGLLFVRDPQAPRDTVLGQLWRWGSVLLVLGMLLEPSQGGIKKDPQTLSFLVLMPGWSFLTLASMMVLESQMRAGGLRLVALTGRNPLLIYVLFTMFISHVAYLVGVGNLFTTGTVPSLLRAIFFTGLTTALVIMATRRKWVWKA